MADNSITRRDALKQAAVATGAAAFATPIVVGVFSSRAHAQTAGERCNPETESVAILATGYEGDDWNKNCNAGGELGAWNAQDTNFTFVDQNGVNQGGTVQVGEPGTDATNLPVEFAYYTIIPPSGFECEAVWRIYVNPYKSNDVLAVDLTKESEPPTGLSLPYPDPADFATCNDTASARLFLESVYCCPAPF